MLGQNFTESTLRNIETYCQEIPYFDFLTKRLLNFHNLFYKTFDICEGSLSTYDDFEYDQYLDDKSRPNLKNIISVEHSKILSDCKIVFSGIIPRDRIKLQLRNYIIDSHLPIHLVNVDWIYCCYYLGTRVLETAFSIEAAKPSDSNQNPSNILLPTSTKRKSKEICVEECPAKLIPSVLEDFLDDNTLNEILQDLDDDPLDSQNNSDNDKNDKEYINIKKTPSTESGDQISWQTSSSSNGEDVNQDELEDYAKKLNSYFL
ncbi:LOW QUALITY PROTEIN: hypothetical protein MXB_1585 [Myxobolus squamalis]|nr:LOW QUALITY PROTEIN: hypothetical protein MXB_1585 [Myxobolus squamalis]